MKNLILTSLILFNSISAYKNFVLISAPGSGKGTFSQYLVKKYGYVQICPGDIYRNEIASQTELGKKIQPIVEQGSYVQEEITFKIIAERLLKIIKQGKNFIIDGFPCSQKSFDFLHQFFKENNIVENVCFIQFVVDDNTCISRIMGRLVCSHCFKVFNTHLLTSKNQDKCDNCGYVLGQRKADIYQVAEKRLQYFHANIEPLMIIAKKLYNTVRITDLYIDDLLIKYDNLIK